MTRGYKLLKFPVNSFFVKNRKIGVESFNSVSNISYENKISYEFRDFDEFY